MNLSTILSELSSEPFFQTQWFIVAFGFKTMKRYRARPTREVAFPLGLNHISRSRVRFVLETEGRCRRRFGRSTTKTHPKFEPIHVTYESESWKYFQNEFWVSRAFRNPQCFSSNIIFLCNDCGPIPFGCTPDCFDCKTAVGRS